MLQRYKEVFYGLLFGMGSSVIDVMMHASMEQQGFWTELFRPDPVMLAYRVSFIVFGLVLGWLLWRKNKAERDFRGLAETIERLQRGIRQPALLIHAKMRVLLTQTIFTFLLTQRRWSGTLTNGRERLGHWRRTRSQDE